MRLKIMELLISSICVIWERKILIFKGIVGDLERFLYDDFWLK